MTDKRDASSFARRGPSSVARDGERKSNHERETNHDRFVDELLGSALAQYSRVEPEPGLEARLHERLAAEEAHAARSWWIWVPVGAAAAALFVLAAVHVSRRPAPSVPVESVAAVPPAPVEAPAPAQPAPERAAARRTPAAARQAPPRLAQFPAPAPLSEQERLLLRYVREVPEGQLVAWQLGERRIEPLRIEPLLIPPLSFEPN